MAASARPFAYRGLGLDLTPQVFVTNAIVSAGAVAFGFDHTWASYFDNVELSNFEGSDDGGLNWYPFKIALDDGPSTLVCYSDGVAYADGDLWRITGPVNNITWNGGAVLETPQDGFIFS